MAIARAHRRTSGEAALPFATSERLPLRRSWLKGLQPVPFGTKAIDLVEHSLEERVGRGSRYPRPLKLRDFLALAAYLDAHALDFTPDEFNVRHAWPPRNWKKRIRTKKEQKVESNVGGKTEFRMADNTQKDPQDWVSGNDPMTGAQAS